MSSSLTDAVWTTTATVGVHLCVCVPHKDLSVTLGDKCHRWCHHTPILETDGPKTAWKNGTFLFFFSARVHTHWDLLTNLLKSTHWLGFGRDLSTAVSFCQHIQLSPQPSQRTPAKRVETRGFICGQPKPSEKQHKVHLDQNQTPCWMEAGLTSAHTCHYNNNKSELTRWETLGTFD